MSLLSRSVVLGAALTVTNVNSTVEDLLREKSPAELEQINRSTLRAMGASGSDTERILHGGAFTPTQPTTFAVHLKALKGVANRGAFVAPRRKKHHRADALFCVYTAALMDQIHKKRQSLGSSCFTTFRSASPQTEQ